MEERKPPWISLSLPVYNGERFLPAAIASILQQTLKDFELIITDNASTDNTESICRDFMAQDRRIRYVRNARNIGAGPNFNLGFEAASGKYFKWCACDDVLAPDYIGKCVEVLDADVSAVTAYGRLVGIDQNAEPTGHLEAPMPELQAPDPAVRFRAMVRRQMLDAAIFGLHRRAALRSTSLHRPYYGSDCALLAELSLLGRLVVVPGTVLYSRDHPDRSINLTNSDRITWQTAEPAKANPTEFSRRVLDLMAVSLRHRQIAPAFATGSAVLLWTAHPYRMARLALEASGLISPSFRARLRSAGVALLRRFEPVTGGGPD